MGKLINLTGKKFGRLIVIKRAENKNQQTCWLCKCDCGNYTIVEAQKLKKGHTKSCGCLQKEAISQVNYKHGLRKTRLYRIWYNMKQRCYNTKSQRYSSYGGRDITICDEWLNDFMTFYNWAMANGYQDNLTIDRIDNNRNYCPENCRWANDLIQRRNTTRTHLITYNKETHCLTEWAEITGLSRQTLYMRLKNGWSIKKAFTTP